MKKINEEVKKAIAIITNEYLAEWLHDNYEELSKVNGWDTQKITQVKFDELPQKNKATMLALAKRIQNHFLNEKIDELLTSITARYFGANESTIIKKIISRIELNDECIENFNLDKLNKELVEKENEFLYEILGMLIYTDIQKPISTRNELLTAINALYLEVDAKVVDDLKRKALAAL